MKSAIDIRCGAFPDMYELTLPARIELGGVEEEKALENLFFAFGKASAYVIRFVKSMSLREECQKAR